MRNIIYFTITVLFLFGCKKNDDFTINIPDNYYKNGVYVNVDSRMELLAIVQHFTTWADEHHTKYKFGYLDEIEYYFRPFANYPAVKASQELTDNEFSYDAPPIYILFHNEPPELTQLINYSEYLKDRAQGEQNLIDFTEKLRDFSSKTSFIGFFDGHRNFYDKMLTVIFNALGNTNYVSILENYYGESKHKYVIIPTPLFHAGGYGSWIDYGEGQVVYDIIGPTNVKNNIPTFGNESDFKHILLHEFSHSFVNQITEKYINEINKSQLLFNPIKAQMTEQAYSNWFTCVNEHLVRINVIRMRVEIDGEGIKNSLIESEKSNGFIYITQLDTLMQRYESNRVKYPTYEDFYPEIIKLFNTLSGTK